MVSESFGFTGPYVCWAVCDFMELHGTLGTWVNYHNYPGLPIHSEGNSDKSDFFFETEEEDKLVDFMEYSRYFQDLPKPRYPKPRYPSHANSRDKESLNSSTQAKPSRTWGAAWGAQARCSSAALPSDYITRPVALVQHCSSRGAAGMQQQQGDWGVSLWYVCYATHICIRQ